MVNKIKIGNYEIGNGNKPFIIAEAGVNHNGKISEAIKLAKKAKQIGAHCIKFQTFKTEDLLLPNTQRAKYQKKNTRSSSSQNLMLKKLEFNDNDFKKIFEYCKKIGIEFMSTPYSLKDVDFLDKLGVNAFKLSSMHLSEPYFIKYVLKKNKPLILSTGMSSLKDINYILDCIKNEKNQKIILLHCTTDYPTKIDDINLLGINSLKNEFNYLVGLSDHSKDNMASIMSIALGSSVIEKHFTLDKKNPGPDHSSSLDPKEFSKLIDDINKATKTLGSSVIKLTDSEKINSKIMKRSIVVSHDIVKGKKITKNDIICKRPAGGLEPKYFEKLIGKKIKKNLKKNSYIYMKDVI